MITLPGYTINTKIHHGKKTLVYRGYCEKDAKPFIIKVLKKEYPSDKDLARFKREYEIIKMLQFDGVVQVCSLLPYHQHSLALVFEDFGGMALNQWCTGKLDLDSFFPIALDIVKILEKIHYNNIIHKDIKPANIVIHPETYQVKIIDFGISSLLSRENTLISNPKLLEGTLAYMSPEQTGWMNRELDYRSDFYSLGVTFYEMLSGETPFTTKDPMELIHCHIAKPIVPLTKKSPNFPLIVSEIILKLLSKTPEKRYQSCYGLHYDLQRCFSEWQNCKTIQRFNLAEKEISHKFQMSEKLHGRKNEISYLLQSFKRVNQGAKELMLVKGYAGIGKSTLIKELHKKILEKKGFFIQGKFDQLQQHVPYSAITKAFHELVRHILAENRKERAQWKQNILKVCGDEAQALIKIIPEVELIIGKQPSLKNLSTQESENRFNYIITEFLQLFARKKQPVILFLDDLQWADLETLKFLEVLSSNSKIQYFLLLIAYRKNEVNSYHPLNVTLEKIKKTNIAIQELHLQPLNRSDIDDWIKSSLFTDNDIDELTSLVLAKTGGNPFFVKEFMTMLYKNEWLKFENSRWTFDLTKIKKTYITENVVELLCSRINDLPALHREILQLASCIGNTFDTKMLLELVDVDAKESLHVIFNELINQSFIFAQGSYNPFSQQNFYFQFSHDRVQQAAYSMISEKRLIDMHLRIGRFLIKNASKEEDKFFDTVNHMNKGLDFVTAEEQASLVILNYEAGSRAMQATAYVAAANFFRISRSLLPKKSWTDNYDLTFDIYSKEAECEYLNSNFEQSQYLFEILLKSTKNRVKIAQIYTIKITLLSNQGKHVEACELGKKGLELFGVILPSLPGNKRHVLFELVKIQIYLIGKKRMI